MRRDCTASVSARDNAMPRDKWHPLPQKAPNCERLLPIASRMRQRKLATPMFVVTSQMATLISLPASLWSRSRHSGSVTLERRSRLFARSPAPVNAPQRRRVALDDFVQSGAQRLERMVPRGQAVAADHEAAHRIPRPKPVIQMYKIVRYPNGFAVADGRGGDPRDFTVPAEARSSVLRQQSGVGDTLLRLHSGIGLDAHRVRMLLGVRHLDRFHERRHARTFRVPTLALRDRKRAAIGPNRHVDGEPYIVQPGDIRETR